MPPADRGRGPVAPTQPIHDEPDQLARQGTPGSSRTPEVNTPELEHRCGDGRGCVEVTARTVAAHVARYIDHDDDQADRLFAAAQRWASAHNYGAPAEDPARGRHDIQDGAA